MTNAELLALSRRLRGKAAILLDADIELAHDMHMASFALDDLFAARLAVDAAIAGAMPCYG